TLNPQEAIGDYFDVLCVGEGERPTLELVSQLEKGGVHSHIPNMWFKRGSGVERNPPREFLQELDSLPFPDRRMWRDWQDQRAAQRCDVLLSRGCPFNCSYCCNHAFRNVSGGNYVRHRSPQNIVKEIKDILAELPKLKEIYLETETITLDTRWCIALCSELEGLNKTLSRPLSFGANVRITPNGNLEDIFSAFKKANFRFVKIGLESGSERVRQEILRRNYSNRDIINSVALARKYGLQINLYNLIGVPGETLSDFEETVAINRICKPDGHMTSIFFPYPGTDLYARCKEEGLLKGLLDTRNERERAVLDLPGFSRKQIQESFYLLDYYIRYDPESGRLRGIHIIFYKLYKRLFSLPLFRNLAGVLKKLSKPNTPFFI
ncbi:MAG: radical SAM protein, partial [Candidatus Omnitrophica bacterium]|nr:radical SAM protein [Candidatus Omnitrophota bacterium]